MPKPKATLLYKYLIIPFLFISCSNNVYYDFLVRNVDDSEMGKIVIRFVDARNPRGKEHAFTIDLNHPTRLSIKKNYVVSSFLIEGDSQVWFNPSITKPPQRRLFEIFVFKPILVNKISDKTLFLKKANNVSAYFVKYINDDDRVVTIISNDNELTESEIQFDLDITSLLDREFDDITYSDKNMQLQYEWLKESNHPIGGYIVRSKIDTSILWLQ